MKLWYKQPAKTWVESLPLGNGRIGAMVYGQPIEETIALNEDTLWSGYPTDRTVNEPYNHLREVKRLLKEERFHEAGSYIEKNLLGEYTQSYLPFGELKIQSLNISQNIISHYQRELDLDTAVSSVAFQCGAVDFRREMFVSAVEQVLVIKFTASEKASVSLKISFACQLKSQTVIRQNVLILDGYAPSFVAPSYYECDNPILYEDRNDKKGMGFGARAVMENIGGNIYQEEDGLCVNDADSVIIKVFLRTSFNGFDKQPYVEGIDYEKVLEEDNCKADKKSYEQLKQDHIADYQNYYNRVELELGGEPDIPTDERLIQFQDTKKDNYLYAMIFQYGRYLMISSSRAGTQATNLQGIWNDKLRAPFSCNYTLNINTQMNYWGAENCNLAELHQPLFSLIEVIKITGAKTARDYYNASGYTAHHNTDIWGLSTPVGHDFEGMCGCCYWNLSLGWLTRHLVEHYEYSLDKDFLKNTAYPTIKGVAQFYLDTLEKNEDGYYWMTPSISPENSFLYNGKVCKVTNFTTMTNAIIREVFQNVIKCCKILEVDTNFAQTVKEIYEGVYPYQIGKEGELLEWDREYEENEIHHRHISHLYPLYPGNELHIDTTPELIQACKKSLDKRSDKGTGWSLGWKMNARARLQEGNHALEILKLQLRYTNAKEICFDDQADSGTYMNLFDAHPPFQIDGNFAATAGICEMLLQSYDDKVLLLPALPDEFTDGYVKGLRAKNGITVNIFFEKGVLKKAEVQSTVDTAVLLLFGYKGKWIERRINAFEKFVLEAVVFI